MGLLFDQKILKFCLIYLSLCFYVIQTAVDIAAPRTEVDGKNIFQQNDPVQRQSKK